MKPYPIDYDGWHDGMTLDIFVANMKNKQTEMKQRIETIVLQPEERQFFRSLTRKVFVLVMTEDWCGDSLMVIPILGSAMDSSHNMHGRFFIRGQEDALNTYYQERGIAKIPVITFLDEDFQEIGTWVERSQAAHGRVTEWRARHPEIMEIRGNPDLSPEEKRELMKPISANYMAEMENWYADELQSATIKEWISILNGE